MIYNNTTEQAMALLRSLNLNTTLMEKTMKKRDKLDDYTHSVVITAPSLLRDATIAGRNQNPRVNRFLWACDLTAYRDYLFTISKTSGTQVYHFKSADAAALLSAFQTYNTTKV
jgi:hypothetical protein